ncbi:MAG TPA: sialidase family protein [Candidatus Limnocylindria bacterium]|nr:sialidase family protein [Candidatus Limnocylindria bacterium]
MREITPPFLVGRPARDPAIAADPHGRVALTFVTRDSAGADLWLALSTDSGATFSPPERVNPRPGSVASYPEGRPLAAFGPAGQLVVAWAERREGQGGVDLFVRASADGGRTLESPVPVNDDVDDGRPDYHGFPALAFLTEGAVIAAWLDEREAPKVGGEATYSALFSAISRDGGQSWSDNRKIADLVCPCCRPMLCADSAGNVAVAFRTADENLRDPMLAVSRNRGVTFAQPALISDDRWKLAGCPDVGPAITAAPGGGGHYAWYTGVEPAGVYLVPWRDGLGPSGVKRAVGDGLLDATRPRLAAFGPATLLAVEGRPLGDTTRTVLAVRLLEPDGMLTPWTHLGADVAAGWIAAAGPRAAYASWAEREGDETRMRIVRIQRRSR